MCQKALQGLRCSSVKKKNVQFVRSEFLTSGIVYLNSNVYSWLWFGTGCYVFMCEMRKPICVHIVNLVATSRLCLHAVMAVMELRKLVCWAAPYSIGKFPRASS